MLETSGADDEGRTVCVTVTQLHMCPVIVAGSVHHDSLRAVGNHIDQLEEKVSVVRVECVPGDLRENICDLLVSRSIYG